MPYSADDKKEGNDHAQEQTRYRALAARLPAPGGQRGLRGAACGAGAGAPAAGQPTAQPGAQAPAQGNTAVTEITFWWWDDGGKIWASEYAKVNPKIKVNFINTPFADAHSKLLTSFASGSGA